MQRQAEPEQLNSDKPLAIKWEENCDLIHLSPSLSSLFACHLNNSTFGPLKISDRRHQATRAEMILSGTTAALLTEGWKLCSLNGTIQLRFYLAFLHFSSPCTKWACRDLNLSPFSQEECTYFLKHSTVIWARAGEAKAGGSTMALQASGCKLKGMRQPNKSEQELLTTCLNIQDNTSILGWCPSLTALLTHSTPQTGYGRERERQRTGYIWTLQQWQPKAGIPPSTPRFGLSLFLTIHSAWVSSEPIFPVNFPQEHMFWIHSTNGPQWSAGCTLTLGSNQAELT